MSGLQMVMLWITNKSQNRILQKLQSLILQSMGVNRSNEQTAIALMKKHIEYTWINTTMGSGFEFTLKVDGCLIYEHKYLDIFELPEDVYDATEVEKKEYYDEWKENLRIESFEKFAAICEVKYLYFFL